MSSSGVRADSTGFRLAISARISSRTRSFEMSFTSAISVSSRPNQRAVAGRGYSASSKNALRALRPRRMTWLVSKTMTGRPLAKLTPSSRFAVPRDCAP